MEERKLIDENKINDELIRNNNAANLTWAEKEEVRKDSEYYTWIPTTLTPKQAYEMIFNNTETWPNDRGYYLDAIAEDDFNESRLILERLKKLGVDEFEIKKVNDVFIPYLVHGIIIEINYKKLPSELRLSRLMTHRIGKIFTMMDNVYISSESNYITMTKQIYRQGRY